MRQNSWDEIDRIRKIYNDEVYINFSNASNISSL